MIEQLDENIDDLGAALNLLLENSLVENAQKLPPLERSKLYVLVTYAIESLMFCKLRAKAPFCAELMPVALLRLNGINAKEHPVFRELTRVKQYFEKIKVAEFGEEQQAPPRMRVDQPAAGRMLKHALVRFSTSGFGLNPC